MNDQELATLLNDLESDRVERKASISDRNIIRQAICAFANDLPNHQQPGVLFIGVNNDGTCANLPISDQLLLTLSEYTIRWKYSAFSRHDCSETNDYWM